MSHLSKPVLNRHMGEGGAYLDKSTGKATMRDIFKAVADGMKNRVATGFHVMDPTTPSAQVTGAGATTWNVDVAAGRAMVNGKGYAEDAQADFVIHSGSQLVTNGQSCKAAIVIKNNLGTFTMMAVKGAAATTGSEKAPTQKEIQAAVGADVPWIQVALCTINRTADTTVTQSQDNTQADLGLEFTVE